MTCPHCGADVIAGYTFCQSCRKRVVAPGPGAPADTPTLLVPPPRPAASPLPPAPTPPLPPHTPPPSPYGAAEAFGSADLLERPGPVTVLAVVDLIQGALVALVGAGMFLLLTQLPADAPPMARFMIAGMGLAVLAGGLVNVLAGVGLLRLAGYGRILQLVLAGLSLLSLPFGTIVGVLQLIYFLKPGAAVLFSGRSAGQLTPREADDVRALHRAGSLIFIGLALQVLVCIGAAGFLAAIAIPSLLRARVAGNEASAIGDVRTMISAQAAYSAENQGFYDSYECLITPTGCTPGQGRERSPFLDAQFANASRHGYTFQLHLGPAPDNLDNTVASASSVTTYAYVAVPTAASRTGVRSFCGDATGSICAWPDGRTPEVENGACPADCPPLY